MIEKFEAKVNESQRHLVLYASNHFREIREQLCQELAEIDAKQDKFIKENQKSTVDLELFNDEEDSTFANEPVKCFSQFLFWPNKTNHYFDRHYFFFLPFPVLSPLIDMGARGSPPHRFFF